MINPKTLNEWAPYSLHQRAILIEQKFGVKVSLMTVLMYTRGTRSLIANLSMPTVVRWRSRKRSDSSNLIL
jgi:hypothetical protein